MTKTIQTDLICPECGNTFPIQRKASKQKKIYHRKYLYCPICMEVTNHIETKDINLLIEKIMSKEENTRTEDEQKVLKLRKRND